MNPITRRDSQHENCEVYYCKYSREGYCYCVVEVSRRKETREEGQETYS